ncbi:hypothetical protein BGX27_003491, partial [Mortierella sp. AM989]
TVPAMNERQHFAEIVIPPFGRAFRLIGKLIELFEIKILGCMRRKNEHWIPVLEKVTHTHQADGVASHNGFQVLFECAPPVVKDADRSFLDHYKLARGYIMLNNTEAIIPLLGGKIVIVRRHDNGQFHCVGYNFSVSAKSGI